MGGGVATGPTTSQVLKGRRTDPGHEITRNVDRRCRDKDSSKVTWKRQNFGNLNLRVTGNSIFNFPGFTQRIHDKVLNNHKDSNDSAF